MEELQSYPDFSGQVRTEIPPSVAKALSYYASTSYSEDPVTAYKQSVAQYSLDGKSDLVDTAQKRWEQEQDESAKIAISELAADPSVPDDMKRAALQTYIMGGFVAPHLREKYKQKIAAAEAGRTARDQSAQDIWAMTMEKRDRAAAEVQEVIDRFGTTLDGNVGLAIAGVARDVLPVAQLGWNLSVAKIAQVAGVSKPWDIFLPGSANKRIKEKFNALPPEEKLQFVTTIVEAYKGTPSFDINKWLDFQAQIERDPEPAWMTTLDNVAGMLNFIGLGYITRGPVTAAQMSKAGKARPFKPKPGATAREGDTIEGTATRVPDDALELSGPKVPPRSPAGTTAVANPAVANRVGAAAVAQPGDEFAEALGASKGEILSDWSLPKLDDSLDQIYPDIADELRQLDRKMRGVYTNTKYNPAVFPVTQREQELERLYQTFREINGPTYQQSNSLFEETARTITGRAIFGRTHAYGYDTIEEALDAADEVAKTVQLLADYKINAPKVITKGDQYYVQWDYQKNYDPFEHLAFGDNSVNMKFAGLKADAVARSWLAKYIPPTMRMDTWVPFGAASSERHAAKVENDFISEIRVNIASTPHKTELYNLLRQTEESGRYLTPQEIHMNYPGMSASQHKELVKAYAYFRRLVDYEYNWANRLDKASLADRGYKGLYVDGAERVYFANPNVDGDALRGVSRIMDMESGVPMSLRDVAGGRQIVRLDEPIVNEHGIFEFAVITGNKARLGPLPAETLPKIDGYIPRRNKENYYVMRIPKASVINGNKVDDPITLRNYSKVVAAGSTMAKAKKMEEQLGREFPNFTFETRTERGDTGIAVITDYKVYKQSLDYGKQRGDRLPTVDGPARIEDPLVSLIETIKTTTRMDAWRNYTEAFKQNFVAKYKPFLRNGQFPENEQDFVVLKGMTPELTNQFKSAQRLFEQWSRQQYKNTFGDEVWDTIFYNLSTVFEKLPVSEAVHEALKSLGKQGNLLVRVPKTLGTHLFMYSNVPRQWIVQPQQLAELAMLDKDFFIHGSRDITAVVMAVLSRTKTAKDWEPGIVEMSRKISSMSRQEFDQIVEAIHNAGVPQSIDLNMTLHGTVRDVERPLSEGMAGKVWETSKATISMPTRVGKAVGYSFAELMNQVGLWMFARQRWLKNNPGKNWNTPEHIEQITNQAWDIGHSMSTRAGSLPFQDGAWSLPMQFAAVQHKAFFQVFSSKTLSTKEKSKIAAARMAIYGVYGVPGAVIIDEAIERYAPKEFQEDWDKWKRGLQDRAVNGLINLFLDPDEPRTDLALSESTSPMPRTLPYLDLLVELSKITKSTPENPRFPFTQAVGSLYEAVSDINSYSAVTDIKTPEQLKLTALEAMEVMSGYNNFAKAMMIKNYQDKMTKFGSPLGLELNRMEMIAQMFGIITQKELAIYSADRRDRERTAFIKQHALNIHQHLLKVRAKLGEEQLSEWTRRMNSMSTFLDEEIRDEIQEEVFRLDRQSLLTRDESVLLNIFLKYKNENDRYVAKMIEDLKASENPQAHQFLEILRKQGVTK